MKLSNYWQSFTICQQELFAQNYCTNYLEQLKGFGFSMQGEKRMHIKPETEKCVIIHHFGQIASNPSSHPHNA